MLLCPPFGAALGRPGAQRLAGFPVLMSFWLNLLLRTTGKPMNKALRAALLSSLALAGSSACTSTASANAGAAGAQAAAATPASTC